MDKESTCNAGDSEDMGLIPRFGIMSIHACKVELLFSEPIVLTIVLFIWKYMWVSG